MNRRKATGPVRVPVVFCGLNLSFGAFAVVCGIWVWEAGQGAAHGSGSRAAREDSSRVQLMRKDDSCAQEVCD